MKKYSFLFFTLFLCVMIHNSCIQDESTYRQNSSRFFNSSGVLDKNVQHFISQLSLKNDSAEFVTTFVENYGFPLWKEAFSFPIEGRWVYAIPVKYNKQIESIWFFDRDDQGVKYFIFSRKNATGILDDCFWMFDYFEVKLSLYKPKREGERMFFVERPQVDTRTMLVIEYCNDIYVGTEGNLEFQYRYCWHDYVRLPWTMPTPNDLGDGILPDRDGGGGASGGGSGVSNDQTPSSSSIENQIKEKLEKNCGFAAVLKDIGGTQNLQIIFDPNLLNSGQYNPFTKEMKLSSQDINVQDPTFIEELIHYIQDHVYPGGIAQHVGTGKTNIEFEAKVLQDLYQYGRDKKLYRTESRVLLRIKDAEITTEEYKDFLKSIQDNTMTVDDFRNMLGKFNIYTPYSAYKDKVNEGLNSYLLNLYGSKFASYNCK